VRLVVRLPEASQANPERVKTPSNRSLPSRIASFAGLNYLINWSVWLYDLDFVALMMALLIASEGRFFVENAAIALAYKFTKEFLRALVVPLTGVQTPLFARLYAENRIEGLRTAYATLTKVLILGLLPAAVGLILTGRNLLQIIYGQIGGDAVFNPQSASTIVACTAILAVGLFGEAMISVALNVLLVYEDYRAVILARLVSLVSIPLLILLIPPYGAVGGAIAISCAGLGSRLVGLVLGLRRVGLRFPVSFFLRVGSASLVMGVVLLPLLVYLPPNIPATAAMIILGVAVFFGVFKLLGGMDAEDKARLLSLRLPFARQISRVL
jgi:O-antigen/teichoic acid export membrane protein